MGSNILLSPTATVFIIGIAARCPVVCPAGPILSPPTVVASITRLGDRLIFRSAGVPSPVGFASPGLPKLPQEFETSLSVLLFIGDEHLIGTAGLRHDQHLLLCRSSVLV